MQDEVKITTNNLWTVIIKMDDIIKALTKYTEKQSKLNKDNKSPMNKEYSKRLKLISENLKKI